VASDPARFRKALEAHRKKFGDQPMTIGMPRDLIREAAVPVAAPASATGTATRSRWSATRTAASPARD
jgi:hypothetical protein